MVRFPRRCLVLAGGLLLALGLAGCGTTGDEQAAGTTTTAAPAVARLPVAEWGGGVCRALTVWTKGFDRMGTDFDADLEDVKKGDVETVRDLLADLFGEAADQTHVLVGQLKQIGAPDLDKGPAIARELHTGIVKVHVQFTNLAKEVAALDTDDPSGFRDEIDALNDDFQEAIDEISDSLDDFESRYGDDGAAIDEVLRDDAECADVGA